jgi:hypothetical protein
VFLLALLPVLLPALLAGCVSRKLYLVTDPPGARVTIDGTFAGTTPYQEDFLSYGTRRVELELDGYQRSVVPMDVALPWWQIFPLDVVTDLFVPWTIDDERHFAFTLRPLGREEGTWADAYAARERMRALELLQPAADGDE